MTAYRWKPITGLDERSIVSRNADLEALGRVWAEQRESLTMKGLVDTFRAKLMREMAIEAGIIERAYTLDRGITLQLIEHGIHANLIPSQATNQDPRWVAAVIQDHLDAAEGVFDHIKEGRNLTVGFIKQLHGLLMRNHRSTTAEDQFGNALQVELVRGDYKRQPNNPRRPDGEMHEYCPVEHVASEMEQLLCLHHSHLDRSAAPEVCAAWLHHAFTQIHPFQDGNGRMARLLASYVFIRAGYFPLVLVDQKHRKPYIEALETADLSGDLEPLVKLFAAAQREAFVKVLGLASRVQHGATADQLVETYAKRAVDRLQATRIRLDRAKQSARTLLEEAAKRLGQLRDKLDVAFKPAEGHALAFRVDNAWDQSDKAHYFRAQVIEAAKQLDYFANVSLYHDWARLILRGAEQCEILISAHAAGHEYRGLIAVSCLFFRRSKAPDGLTQITDATALGGEWFQVTHLDEPASLSARFEPWLEGALAHGIKLWGESL